jgi:tetratricopeptide (TPR) repeat protein
MMFFFALAHILFLCYDKYKRSVILAALAIVFTYSGLTYARSDLWGNPLLLLSVWTENNPGSSRNYIEGHVQAHRLHRYDLAQKFLERGIEALPDNIFLRIGYTSYGCGRGSLLKSDVEKLKIMLGETEQTISHYLYQNLAQLLGTSFSPDCKLITHEDMREIISSVLNNPNILTYELRLHEMLHLMGRFELQVENYSEAKEAFLKSLLLNLNPSTALQQVALIATFEQYELAYEYLKETRELIYGRDDVELRKQSAGWEEFEYMESVLLEELKDMPLRN